MQRILVSFFVVLAAVSFAAAQGKTLEAINKQLKSLNAEKTMEAFYVKEANINKVTALGADFGKAQDSANNLSAFNFGMAFFFAGNTLTAPVDSFTTTFWIQEKKPTFADSNQLTIIVDGENLEIGNARYARKNGDPREFLNYVMPRSVIEKIAGGKDARLKIGAAQFKFTPEHIQLFKNLLAVSDPAR